MPFDPPLWMWITLGTTVWFVLAGLLGVLIGKVVAAADLAEGPSPTTPDRVWRR